MKLLCIIFSFAAVVFSSPLNASENAEKFYISPEAISIESNGFVVFIDMQAMPVSAIHCDNNGYYITGNDYRPKSWTCPKCGYENSWLANWCKNPACKYRPGQDK